MKRHLATWALALVSTGSAARVVAVDANSPPATSVQGGAPVSQAVLTSSQPALASSQPALASSQPGFASSQPALASSQPALASSQPGLASSQPALASSQPGFASSQPALASSQAALARWQAALADLQAAAKTWAPDDATAFCGSADALRPLHFRLHDERQQLLRTLSAQGLLSAAPPETVAWPWGSGDPATRRLSAIDSLDTAVVVDDGRIVFTNLNGALEVDPFEAAQAFYQAFDDEYDFLILFTNFPSQLVGGQYLAYHLGVANDVVGLGYRHIRPDELFDDGPEFTGNPASGSLRSFIHFNDLQRYPDDAETIYWRDYTAPAFMAHEIGHRWGARIRLCPSIGAPTGALGRGEVHWSFFFDSHGSVLEGNAWESVLPYQISSTPTTAYSPLDLYLMGMLDPADVGIQGFLLEPVDCSPSVDERGFPWAAGSAPQADVRCTDNSVYFDLDCVVEANGARAPAYPDAQRDFRVATLLVTRPGVPFQQAELEKIQQLRQGMGSFFQAQTLGRGSLDFELRPVPARLHFEHRTQGNVEDPSQPISIETGIVLEQRSLPTSLDDVLVTLHYSVDGADFQVIPLQRASADRWSGEIPPQPLDSEVRYFLRGTTILSEHVATLPAQAPAAVFSFRVAPDTTPPNISHVPLRTHGRNTEPALIRAVVFDNHAVADVVVEYGVAGQPVQQQSLFPVGTSDVYETRLVPPGSVGEIVQYRIVARDEASTPHVTALPAAGAFDLEITRPQILDAETEDLLWSHRSLLLDGPDEWHREHIGHGGNWSWKLGPDNISTNPRVGRMTLEQDAVLEGPAVRLQEGWEMRFYHRYYLRIARPEGDGTGVDGAIVQIQDVEKLRDVQDDRWWLVEPQARYPMHVGGYAIFNALRGYPCWSGEYDAWRLDRISGALNPGLEGKLVRFRFRVAAGIPIGLTVAGAGWYIDDIEIDPGIAVPVSLQELQARYRGDAVVVSWRAAELEKGDVFRLSRADVAGESLRRFVHLATLEAIPSQQEYSYVDADVAAGQNYAYRVTLIRGDQARSLETRVDAAPLRFALHHNRPNPFNPATLISFDLAEPGPTSLTIYDVSGKRVRRLLSGMRTAGAHRTTWNGTDEAGRAVASGVYLCVLQSGSQRATQRMLLLR